MRDSMPAEGKLTLHIGGTIKMAAVDVSGAPFVDLADEVRMAFLRD